MLILMPKVLILNCVLIKIIFSWVYRKLPQISINLTQSVFENKHTWEILLLNKCPCWKMLNFVCLCFFWEQLVARMSHLNQYAHEGWLFIVRCCSKCIVDWKVAILRKSFNKLDLQSNCIKNVVIAGYHLVW